MPVNFASRPYWESVVGSIYLNAAKNQELPPAKGQEQAPQQLEKVIIVDHRPLFDFSYRGPWIDLSRRGPLIDLSSKTTVVHVHKEEPKSKEESDKTKKKKEFDIAKWVGSIGAGFAAAATGYFWTAYWDAHKVVNATGEIKNALLDQLPKIRDDGQAPSLAILYDILDLVSAKYEIDSRNCSKARDYLLSSTLLLVGGISTAAGGFLHNSKAVTAGYITMLIAGAILIFNIGAHWRDNAKNLDAYKIIVGYKYTDHTSRQPITVDGLAVRVQAQFPQYDEQMKLLPPPQYGASQQHYVPVYDYVQVEDASPPYNPYFQPSAPPRHL